MAVSFFGNPPPGVDLSESRTARDLVFIGILFVLALFFVMLRVYTVCRLVRKPLGLDDYLMFVGLAFSAGTLACCIAASFYGLGKHLWVISQHDMRQLMVITWAFIPIHAWSVCIIKCSILALYRRIFGMTRLAWFALGLTIGYLMATHIVLALFARPLTFYWDQFYGAKGRMLIDERLFYIIISTINLVGDVLILTIPISSVLKLRIDKAQKYAICLIFMLGGFVCIASLYRIIIFAKNVPLSDLSYARSGPFLWSSVEPSVGVISGCLPTLRPLMLHVMKAWFKYVPSIRSTSNSKESRSIQLNPIETISQKRVRKISKRDTLNDTNCSHLGLDDDEMCLTTTEIQADSKATFTANSTVGSQNEDGIIVTRELKWDESCGSEHV